MGIKKRRNDVAGETAKNGSVPWFTNWIGGPSLAMIRNCPTPFGNRTVYVQGEADTYFSIPAACQFRRRVITGWIGCEDGTWTFHPHTGDGSVYPNA